MRVYPPLSSTNELNVHDTKSELDVQIPLCAQLTADGFTVMAGLTRASKGLKRVSFDVVVFKDKKAIAIIEVKREDEGHRIALDQTEQGFKYRHFGVPVILFWDLTQYDKLREFLNGSIKVRTQAGDDLRVDTSKKLAALGHLRALRRRLDVASMVAFDAKGVFPEVAHIEATLEKFRDQIDEAYKTL